MVKIEKFNADILNKENSLYICAAGFEERSLGLVRQMEGKCFTHSLILEYTAQKEDNNANFEILTGSLKKISSNIPIVSPADLDNPLLTQQKFIEQLEGINNGEITQLFFDISGMSNSLILQLLIEVYKLFWDRKIYIFYTEAENYYPNEEQVKEMYTIIEEEDFESFGSIFSSSGAKENIILPDFKGRFKDSLPICLIFFVGYEPIRSKSLIEQYCPNLVAVCYGESPHDRFKWRTGFSKNIHKKVFENFSHINSKDIINKDISTYDINNILKDLEVLYNSFYKDYNICITPQCSKLQAIATYLFTLTHPDVQVLFCLPGYFNPNRYAIGIGSSHIIKLEKWGQVFQYHNKV